MEKGTTKKIAIGAMIAAATGYVAGILTAPKSGKETRKDIHDAAIKGRAEAEKALKKMYGELSDLIEQGTNRAKDLQSGARQQLSDALLQAQIAKDKAKELLSALHEGDAEDKDLKKAMDEVRKAADHLKAYLAKNEPK